MAIDPTIALGIRPVESPLDSYGKALGVQNMQNQNTLANLGIQKEQTALTTQKNMNDAIQQSIDPSTGLVDYNKVGQKLAALGSGSAVPGVMKQGYEVDQERVKSASQKMAFNMDNVGREFFGVAGMPAPTKADAMTALQRVIQGGFLDPAHAQDFATALANAPEDPNAIRAIALKAANGAVDLKTQFERANPKTATQVVGGQIVPVTTTQATGQVTAGKPLVVTPQDELGKAKQDLQNGLITQDEYNKREQKINHFAPNTTILMGGPGGPPGAIPDYSNPLKDPGEEAMAKAIAAKQQDPIKVSSRNYAYATRVNGRAASLGGGELPGSVGVAEQKAGELAFGPKGAQGQALQNIDTATGHLAHLQSLIGAMNNGDSRALNAASNWFTTQFGGAAPNNFDTVKSVAIPEVLKVAKGAGIINEQEERQLQAVADRAGSPAQLNGFISQFQHIMGSRAEALDPVYQRYFPGHRIGERLRPSTVDMFKGIGLDLTAKPDQKGPAGPTTPGGQPATQVNPANGKTYYLHSDGKYYLTQAQ